MRKTLKINEPQNDIKEVLDSFILNCKVRGLSNETIEAYNSQCTMFIQFIGSKNIQDVTSSDIDKYVLYCRTKGNNNTSIRTKIKILKAFFNFSEVEIKFPVLTTEKVAKNPYNKEEIQALLKKPTINSYTQWRNWTMVNTLLATGMRCRTLINLKVKDIDFTNNTIYLSTTKTKKSYYIPLSHDLKLALKYYLSLFSYNENDYLFLTLYAEQMSRSAVKQTIRDYNLSKGITKTSIHLFRHTFAINAIKMGMPLPYLQEVLGHSSIETTRQYLHITVEDLKQDFNMYSTLDNMNRKGIKLTNDKKKAGK